MRCSTHKGAFIINDFLRNLHFNALHNILSLTAYEYPYESPYESNVNDDFYIDEESVAGAALFALGALAIAAHSVLVILLHTPVKSYVVKWP